MAICLLRSYGSCFSKIYFICIQNIFYVFLLQYLITSIHSSQVGNIEKRLSQNFTYYNETRLLRDSRSLPHKPHNNENSEQTFESLQNSSLSIDEIKRKEFWEQIYGKMANDEMTRKEQIAQISSWLHNEDGIMAPDQDKDTVDSIDKTLNFDTINDQNKNGGFVKAEALKAEKLKNQQLQQNQQQLKQIQTQASNTQNHKIEAGEGDEGSHNYESNDEDNGPSGSTKTPPCAHYGRYYCSYKEDYPIKVVTEVTKYYKWPLEKLFRDLRQQVMPTLANDNSGGLVCDSVTRIIRAGWAKNTNGRWLVVINTDYYQQYVTEVICRHGTGSHCNFIPPCYHASCRQRYNTQKLLVIDPWNPYKGPFLSEFLFPSCCICFVPGETHDSQQSASNKIKDKLPGIQTNHQTFSDKSSSQSPTEVSSPTSS